MRAARYFKQTAARAITTAILVASFNFQGCEPATDHMSRGEPPQSTIVQLQPAEMLASPDSEVRINGINSLDIKDPKTFELLDKILKTDSSEYVKTEAAHALGRTGEYNKKAADLLIEIVENAEEQCNQRVGLIEQAKTCVVLAAIQSLGMLGEKKAVPALIKRTRSEESSVKCEAAVALGEIGDRRAIIPLIHLIADKDEYVPENALDALANFKDAWTHEIVLKATLVRLGFKSPNSRTINKLVDQLVEGDVVDDSETRELSEKALVMIGKPAVNTLVAVVKAPDDEKNSRELADKRLRLHDAADRFNEVNASGRPSAGGHAREFYEMEVAGLALDKIEDKPRKVYAAITILGEIGDRRAVDALVKKLDALTTDGRMDYGLVKTAATALGKIGDKKALEALRKARDRTEYLGLESMMESSYERGELRRAAGAVSEAIDAIEKKNGMTK